MRQTKHDKLFPVDFCDVIAKPGTLIDRASRIAVIFVYNIADIITYSNL